MKTYGPTFAQELITAGVGGLPFSWLTDGSFNFDDSITTEQRVTIQAVADAHDPTPPIIIPDVTPRQIRMALSRAGLRTSVEAAIAAGSQDLKDWYEFSTTFQRNQPLVIQMGIDLGQSPAQLDALWQLAASL